jgi:hypothetical protein
MWVISWQTALQTEHLASICLHSSYDALIPGSKKAKRKSSQTFSAPADTGVRALPWRGHRSGKPSGMAATAPAKAPVR